MPQVTRSPDDARTLLPCPPGRRLDARACFAPRPAAVPSCLLRSRVHLADRAAHRRAGVDRLARSAGCGKRLRSGLCAPGRERAGGAQRVGGGARGSDERHHGEPRQGPGGQDGGQGARALHGHLSRREEVRQLARSRRGLSVRARPGPGHQGLGSGCGGNEGRGEAQAGHPAVSRLRAARPRRHSSELHPPLRRRAPRHQPDRPRARCPPPRQSARNPGDSAPMCVARCGPIGGRARARKAPARYPSQDR
jgi:hypothetical protein